MTVNHDVAGSSPAGGAINGTSYLVPFFCCYDTKFLNEPVALE